ncbi:MAG TPA: nucleotidyltransferase domain-containing protein [Spirochaetota bacterium]|nr:nucleotidyltransferase domain-containing protein [Spirochaetota bacterium]
MAEREIVEIINVYIAVLKEKRIRFDKIILFGSSVNGKPDRWSDIDVAVISPDFGKDILEERFLLARLSYQVDPRLEVHPVSAFEFENESWKTIIHEIKTTGIEIAA